MFVKLDRRRSQSAIVHLCHGNSAFVDLGHKQSRRCICSFMSRQIVLWRLVLWRGWGGVWIVLVWRGRVIGPGVIAPDSLLGGGDAGQRGRCSRVGARGGIRPYDAEARVFFFFFFFFFFLWPVRTGKLGRKIHVHKECSWLNSRLWEEDEIMIIFSRSRKRFARLCIKIEKKFNVIRFNDGLRS